ncbi:MAG: ABC transporter permease [Anaerolineae bacterium]|nr:ABC transporter permease [Anaerolineae bacterium]
MRGPVRRILLTAAPLLLTLALSVVILLVAGANPFAAYGHLLAGAFESPNKLADIAVAMVPLALCSAGMLITFAAGLWNIGVEGQMIAGALMTTWAIESIRGPAALMLPLSVLAGLAGGALWGLLAGVIRTYGHVNEIFAGLGLNFVAAALTNYLIFGPWKPPDGATMSGTDPFPPQAWMPSLGGSRASLLPIVLAVLALTAVCFALRDTHWGLRLKALGLNAVAAERMGINTHAHLLSAFALCGALAGLAGCVQATAVYHRLIPSISGGYGYLSQLVVLLSGLRAQWVPLVVFFFSAIQVGSPRLELRMQLDSSLGGVLQTSIVLFFILVRGLRRRIEEGK